MLLFQVPKSDGSREEWPLTNAHLIGPGDLAIPGKVTCAKGVISCRKRVTNAVALSLLHDAGRMGRLMLQTCLLPDRERPYSLSIELARHRIKMFITKTEEWQLFDLGEDHPALRRWQTARTLFSKAIAEPDVDAADKLAAESLTVSLEATERLALTQAERFIHWRYSNRPASSTTLGVRVQPSANTSSEQEATIKSEFDLTVIPLTWRELEVEEGVFNWEPTDHWLEWARRESKPVVLGPLLDFSKKALPDWIYVWQHDYNTCRDLVYEQVERIANRYSTLVGTWNIAAGLNVNDNFQFTAEQMLDLTRMANLIVKQTRKSARTMVEIVQPFGEHCAFNRNAIAPLTYIHRLSQDGVRVDCIGLQLLFGQRDAGRASRDLMQISDLLDRLAVLEKPIVVSAFGVPTEPIDPRGGWWHAAWSDKVQAKWMSRVFAIALSKPFVETVVWSDLVDPMADLPGGGLIDANGRRKPVLDRMVKTRRRLRKPLGPMRLQDSSASSPHA